jgi:hypothetical protein
VVTSNFDLHPNQVNGSIMGNVIGNDNILCGNVQSTQWIITPMISAGVPYGPSLRYVICDGGIPTGESFCSNNTFGTASLASMQQTTQTPPSPGFNFIYANPIAGQNVSQPSNTILNFFGAYAFNQGLFAGSAASPVLFASLSSLTGTANFVYVADATFGSSPCAGGGTGAFAFYVAGAWTCSLGGGGSSSLNVNGSTVTGGNPNFQNGTGANIVNFFTSGLNVQASLQPCPN